MAVLRCTRRSPKSVVKQYPFMLTPNTFDILEPSHVVEPKSAVQAKDVSRLLSSSTHLLDSGGTGTTFHNLPAEIHFHIATFLPGHTLLILAKYGYSARLRCIYQDADPDGVRTDMRYISVLDESIYDELRTRDAFEKTPYPHQGLRPCKSIWSTTRFHCANCEKAVGCAHFPLEELKKSAETRTGMCKITQRKCFARATPVKLWDDRVATWDQMQEAWSAMEGQIVSPPLLSDYGRDTEKPTKSKKKTKLRYTDLCNTLELRDLDFAATRYPGTLRTFGVEAVAQYYIDLYTLFRLSDADGHTVTSLLARKEPYVCPHVDIAQLMARPVIEQPIEFRPHSPICAANTTVADLLCKTLESGPWRADPSSIYPRRSKPLRRFKEQTIWCGYKGDRCRTAVSLQRFRDASPENTVGGSWGLSDLIRLKIVRRWRVDQGPGEDEWQAQNGTSRQQWVNLQ
ncbi:hypothetical protein C7974DRAFT_225260 [Boeremia exigua]|uniref:uncharacterized protein n=1 Tax=Boeremia exigua TaxID=749465 RepID=UPI001E8CA63F|nr:uncharacterized protein C7974DRAFT_225260 [Boeremia exigua]KAH6620046.1 hypothetical protein C7974DRAFT_225260 [Boeremia exigua]